MPGPYACLLVFITLSGVWMRRDVLWVGAVLLCDFFACVAFAKIVGGGTDWLINATVDFAAAALMLCVPITTPKMIAAAWFVPMLITHAILGFGDHSPWHDYMYLVTLSYLAWAQAISIVLWGIWNAVGWARYPNWNSNPDLEAYRRLGVTREQE